MTMTMGISIVYLFYRGMFTLNLASPFAATFSIALYLAEIYGNMLMFLYFMQIWDCLLYTSPSPRDRTRSRMPSSA